jgi:hypothetical protein
MPPARERLEGEEQAGGAVADVDIDAVMGLGRR